MKPPTRRLKLLDPTVKVGKTAERVYVKAYGAELARLRAAGGNLPDAVTRSLGEEAGERALYEAYMSGHFKTSTSKGSMTYLDHYGGMWDRANAGARAGAGGPGTGGTPSPGAALDEPGPPVEQP